MKKLITLILLVVGFVGQAKAWDHVYLRCGLANNSWDNDVYEFDRIDDNDFVIKLAASVVQNGRFYFRPRVNGYGQLQPRNGDADAVVNTSGNYDNGFDTSNTNTDYAFYLPQCASATAVYIRVKFTGNDNNDSNIKWFRIIALVTEDNTTIEYNNTQSWSSVKAYASYDGIPLNGIWPGTAMTSAGGTKYTTTIPYKEGASIVIFDDGTGGTASSNKTADLPFVNNGCYSYSGISGVKTTISSVGYATFSSTEDVDFTTVTSLTAKKAHVETTGRITWTSSNSWTSAHKLIAGEGVLLQGAAGTYTIPIAAASTASADDTNDFKAIDVKQLLPQYAVDADENTNYNYILTNKIDDGTTSGTDAPLGFYLVKSTGSWCKAGTAYLATTYSPSPARGYFPVWNEDTAVDNLKIEAENTNSPVYDLQGRRVANPQKGLYIVNGKKAIIK